MTYKQTKQNLLKALLATIGQNKVCDSLKEIDEAFDILWQKFQQLIEENEPKNNPKWEYDFLGKRSMALKNFNEGYNYGVQEYKDNLLKMNRKQNSEAVR